MGSIVPYVATFGRHVAPIRSVLSLTALLSGGDPTNTGSPPPWNVDVANSDNRSPDPQMPNLSVGGTITLGIEGGAVGK